MASGFGLGFVSGGRSGQVVPIGPRVTIGRDPLAEVCLPADEQGVSARHAQLSADGSGSRIVDLNSTGGTFVDGERIPPGRSAGVRPGSLIRFGEGGPLAVVEELSLLESQVELVLEREDAPGSWALDGPLVIGRGAGCDVRLDPATDVLASSRHLHVLPAFGAAIATDLGSANGTYLDGRRVVQCLLRPGSSLTLGGEDGPRFRVEPVGGAPAPEAAASAADVSPVPEFFRLDVRAGDGTGRILAFAKHDLRFGSFAGLNDVVLRCFPRDLENDKDALERGEPLGAQHGTFALTDATVALQEGSAGRTKLDGAILAPGAEVPLPDSFQVDLGEDTLSLRGRVFRHPRLPPRPPVLGLEGQHPVECLVLERAGDGADHLYLLLVKQATIGSSDDAAIRLSVPGVAPLHALLFIQGGGLWLSQISEHPVAANGVALSPGTAIPLPLGSEFFIGAASFSLSEASPEDFQPAVS